MEDNFWRNTKYAKKNYIGKNITREMINEVENTTGYRLPQSYINLIKEQNGGIPIKCKAPSSMSTSWAENHIEITGIYGIDKQKQYSILGERGDQFWKKVWGYPNIGIYICDCPSAGHDMVALDYTSCGNNGEPKVVHVDQESDYEITVLASSFQEFIDNLYFEEEEDNDEENQVSILWKEDQISFEIKKHSFFGTVLQLNQQLEEGETGWSLVNLKIPEEWEGASISKMNGCIIMKYKESEYNINSDNQGKLLSSILDLDEDNDDELKRIWNLYARVT